MRVPKNKDELLEQSEYTFEKLIQLIDSYTMEDQLSDFPAGTMNRNIRDVLAHLYHWHLMFMNWYTVGMKGDKPEMPAKGYTWKETKELNKSILIKYQDHQLEDVRVVLGETHLKLQSIIENHTNAELFEKKRYSWTGSTTLAIYIRSNARSHYIWAYNLIKKAKRK